MTETRQTLLCHPDTEASVPLTITVGVDRDGGRNLCLHYRLEGATDAVDIPPPQPPAAADGLWRHTCFEAFIGSGRYFEFNFSPSGRYAVYAFDGYRKRNRGFSRVPLSIRSRRLTGGYELSAAIALDALPPDFGRLYLGLSAVIEETGGQLSYWALNHGEGKPDFHDPDHWMPLPNSES